MLWLGIPDERLALDGAGDRGRTRSLSEKTGVGGIRMVKDVVGSLNDGGDGDGDGDRAFNCSGWAGWKRQDNCRPVVVPWI